ncbi:MAG TPA: hypothetical protein VGR22_06305, partial [Thermomicrobiales bacterium]|nr:hypothetical protein [Thermomicrobiales bacterium]
VERDVPHTAIDMDWLRCSFPRPSGDPFNVELGCRNLADIARNICALGVTRFVIADVVETRDQRERYCEAIPSAEVVIIRLTAGIERIRERIAQRQGAYPDPWEPARAAELIRIMDESDVSDVAIELWCRSPREVAEEVVRWLGW